MAPARPDPVAGQRPIAARPILFSSTFSCPIPVPVPTHFDTDPKALILMLLYAMIIGA